VQLLATFNVGRSMLAYVRTELDLDDVVKVNYLKRKEALIPIAWLTEKGEE
jgi:hypothetical protein